MARRLWPPSRCGRDPEARRKTSGLPPSRVPIGARRSRLWSYPPLQSAESVCENHSRLLTCSAPFLPALVDCRNQVYSLREEPTTLSNQDCSHRISPRDTESGQEDTGRVSEPVRRYAALG